MRSSQLFDVYAYLFSRKRFYRLNRGLLHAALRGLGILNYQNATASGENPFLKCYLSSRLKPTVFDVGANEGSYSTDVLALNADAVVFAFEPHPRTYSRLLSRLSGSKNITVINAACGSSLGRLILYDYVGSSGTGHASLHAGVIEAIHKGESERHDVDVITLDTFAKDRGIGVIDLLKIDTEGHELEVLKGATSLLQKNRIRAIQFEFNEMNIVSHVFLKDFRNLLPNYDFYRMLRDGLVSLADDWPPACEIFAFQNVVALPRNPPE